MSSQSKSASHSAVGRVSPVQSSMISGKRAAPCPSQDDPTHTQVGVKRAKSVGDIEQEVRVLLDKKIFRKNSAVKIKAMRKLNRFYERGGTSKEEEYMKYRRAVDKRNGCQLVLIVLQQELDKGDSNRDIVVEAVTFLQLWNYRGSDRRDMMLRFNGVDVIKGAMQSFPGDSLIQFGGIACLMNYTSENETKYQEDLVKTNCIPLISRAMMDHENSETTRKHALIILGSLCAVADPACFEGNVDASAFGFLLEMFQAYKNSDDPIADEVRTSCRSLTSKMLEMMD